MSLASANPDAVHAWIHQNWTGVSRIVYSDPNGKFRIQIWYTKPELEVREVIIQDFENKVALYCDRKDLGLQSPKLAFLTQTLLERARYLCSVEVNRDASTGILEQQLLSQALHLTIANTIFYQRLS